MAMAHIQPLLLLLASFFFLPAFRADDVDFEYCKGAGYAFGNITRVEVSPESFGRVSKLLETVKVTVHGDTSSTDNHSNWRVVEVVRTVDGLKYSSLLKIYYACDLIACPVKPGINFQLTLSQFPYIKHPQPGKYEVRLLDSSKERETIFCVAFDYHYEPPTLASA